MFKNKSFVDLFWSFADNIIQQLINFVVGLILARILVPEEFGLVGIITVFISLSNVFVDGGFSASLINKKDVSNIDYNTVFYTNIIISCALYSILFLVSDSVAIFFNNYEISNLLKISGLNLILISFGSIHRTMIVKNLNFRLITIISFVSVFFSAFAAIYMAYNGFGVYSLVYRILIGQFITVFLFWFLNKWKPDFCYSVNSLKSLFTYGSNIMLSNLLNTLHSNIYYILIGKFFSPITLGYYTRASTFKDLASSNIANTIKRVSFSTLSKISDDSYRKKKFYFFLNITYLIISFCMLILFFLSEEIILILLSDKWISSAEILKIISVSGVIVVLNNLNLDFFAVLGKTKLYLLIEIVGKILVIPVLFIGFFWGFKIFLYSIIFQNLIIFFIIIYKLNSLVEGLLKFEIFLILKFFIMLSVLMTIEYYDILNAANIYYTTTIKVMIVLFVYLICNITSIMRFIKN